MTATPKQSDSVDTYAHFASENLDAEGQPRPIFEYSLGRGIDDGFLATYKVMKISTSVDEGLVIRDEIERGAELIVRSEEHTSELQSLMRISYAVFCLKKKKIQQTRLTPYSSN